MRKNVCRFVTKSKGMIKPRERGFLSSSPPKAEGTQRPVRPGASTRTGTKVARVQVEDIRRRLGPLRLPLQQVGLAGQSCTACTIRTRWQVPHFRRRHCWHFRSGSLRSSRRNRRLRPIRSNRRTRSPPMEGRPRTDSVVADPIRWPCPDCPDRAAGRTRCLLQHRRRRTCCHHLRTGCLRRCAVHRIRRCHVAGGSGHHHRNGCCRTDCDRHRAFRAWSFPPASG